MKKHICIILLASLLLLCACQPTPDEPIVVGKDQTEMLETASKPITGDDAALSLAERLGAPARYTYAYQKGTLTIDADAEIVVPDGELPIVRVFPKDFDQATVTRLWNVLVGDVPMYAAQTETTKEDYEREIEWLLPLLDAENPEEYGFSSREEIAQRLAALQQKYNEAPECGAGAPMDGTLLRGVETDDDGKVVASHTYIEADSPETGYRFAVSNSYDNAEVIQKTHYDALGNAVGSEVRRVEKSSQFTFIKGNEPQADCFVWDAEVKDTNMIPERAKNALHSTPEEAIKATQSFLADAGLSEEYALQRLFLITEFEPEDEPLYAYRAVCTHKVGGCGTLMVGNHVEEDIDDMYAPLWPYEKLTVDVNDNGVYCVQFHSPLSIGETLTEKTNLLPFAQVQAIAEKMLPILFEREAGTFGDTPARVTYRKHIDRVELGLWRIREKDRIDRGLLIPVWAFFGSATETDPVDDYVFTSYYPILLVNAIDGSIIDAGPGY